MQDDEFNHRLDAWNVREHARRSPNLEQDVSRTLHCHHHPSQSLFSLAWPDTMATSVLWVVFLLASNLFTRWPSDILRMNQVVLFSYLKLFQGFPSFNHCHGPQGPLLLASHPGCSSVPGPLMCSFRWLHTPSSLSVWGLCTHCSFLLENSPPLSTNGSFLLLQLSPETGGPG